jgi:urease accessory protein
MLRRGENGKGEEAMSTSVPKRIAVIGFIDAILFAISTPAWAHHVMGGKMPATFAQGLVSGLGHPVIGVDHFLFIVGVGLLAGFMGRKLLLPLAFIIGTWGGAVAHLLSLNIPFVEVGILGSVVLMAIAVIGDLRMHALITAGLVAAAGIFHGYAYAESIFGAEPTPLYAYLAGFAVIQFVIAVAVASAFTTIQKRSEALAQTCARVAGGAMAGVAMFAASNMAFSV